MGPREVIIFSSVLIVAVSGHCNFVSEKGRLNDAIAQCESNISPLYAFHMLKRMINDTLTFEQFVENLQPFCEKASHTLTCLFKNVRVDEDCRVNEAIQMIINMRTLRWHVPNFLCENNATRYLDLAVNDGPACYANNQLRQDCKSKKRNEGMMFNRPLINKRNTCGRLDISFNCSSFYDNCENQNVRLHIGNLNEYLQSQFGCLDS